MIGRSAVKARVLSCELVSGELPTLRLCAASDLCRMYTITNIVLSI